MKLHACHWPNCGKSFTRAEHLRRHALNHEQARQGYICERCSVHFHRPDLLSRHLLRHAKRDEEAGGPGLGVLETRKRTRRAGDGSIVVRPPKRQSRASAPHSNIPESSASGSAGSMRSSSASSCVVSVISSRESDPIPGAPVSPPRSTSGPTTISLDDPDPLLAPILPNGPFEPYVEPIPGQFDAADGSWSLGQEGIEDFLSLDTATDFNMPFAATHNYNWLFDVVSLNDAFASLDIPFEPDLLAWTHLDSDPSAVLLQAASFVERSPDHSDLLELNWLGRLATIAENTSTPSLPHLSEEARQGILGMVARNPPSGLDGKPTPLDSALLDLSALQQYCDLFFTRFNVTYPLIHAPSFDPNTVDLILLAAILSMGATYSSREAHQLAVGIHDFLRPQLFCHVDFSPQPPLWILQAMLIIDCFGKMRAGPKQRERAQLFHCVLIKLIRRSTCCTIQSSALPTVSAGEDLVSSWQQAMEDEQRKRLAMHCFMWDVQHAVLFSQSLCMSAFEIRSALPCAPALWDAPTAEAWARQGSLCFSLAYSEPSFLTVLKGYITPAAVPRPRQLNPLARLVVLHGLMSVSADLKRRDQTILRGEDPERVGSWIPRMSRSYEIWKADFDADGLAMKLGEGQPGSSESAAGVFHSAALVLYRAAQLALQVEVLDIQIGAGATAILGRTVTQTDRDRSAQALAHWVRSNMVMQAAKQAAWMVREAVSGRQGDQEAMNAFHFPWCLYLGTLVCWAVHGGGVREVGSHRVSLDLANLLVALTGERVNESPQYQYDMRGLIRSMAQQLATIRWTVVHDAQKVLMGL
ncbi:C2H2 finger domain transcription factor, partial [Aspergillus homomorphus CBS 101889]